jgi:hypothetical protein
MRRHESLCTKEQEHMMKEETNRKRRHDVDADDNDDVLISTPYSIWKSPNTQSTSMADTQQLF